MPRTRLSWCCGMALILSMAACAPSAEPAPPASAERTVAVAPETAAAVPDRSFDVPSQKDDGYLDDRSSVETVVRSYFNAIDRREYARAWSYWDEGSDVQPYEAFKAGFARTARTQVFLGNVTSDAGAGNLWSSVRIALTVKNTDGTVDHFAGCYTSHLSQPGMQDTVPFKPLGLRNAKVTKVDTETVAKALLTRPCEA